MAGLIFLFGCAGENYLARKSRDGFNPGICASVHVSVERFQFSDPSLKNRKISSTVFLLIGKTILKDKSLL
jgi:hypothetical protein